MTSMRRTAAGVAVAVAGVALATVIMLPLRSHLSVATTALVLVVPVVAGVAVGGFGAGVAAVIFGFLAYDFFFIRPYETLSVGAAQNWVALFVYVVVMVVVARVVSQQQTARAEARRREADARRLYVLSELLMAEKPLGELVSLVVTTIHQAFGPEWVALLLPEGQLRVAAQAGRSLTPAEAEELAPGPGRLQSLGTGYRTSGVMRVALTADGRPIGLLALAGGELDPYGWELLRTYANQAALAIERSQLREQALRSQLLEQVDRWRGAMMAAVSHDLRTPLATVKAAVSTLRSGPDPSGDDREELLGLIEDQTDHLDRLVRDLLDMTRIEAGALELRRQAVPVAELVDMALDSLGPVPPGRLAVDVGDLVVDVDPVLMAQALANLVDNALRLSPPAEPVAVVARQAGGPVEVAVEDHGPGVPWADRDRVFEMFNRMGGGGRAGLGLTIAKAFVEAHHQTIRVEDAPGAGPGSSSPWPASGSKSPRSPSRPEGRSRCPGCCWSTTIPPWSGPCPSGSRPGATRCRSAGPARRASPRCR